MWTAIVLLLVIEQNPIVFVSKTTVEISSCIIHCLLLRWIGYMFFLLLLNFSYAVVFGEITLQWHALKSYHCCYKFVSGFPEPFAISSVWMRCCKSTIITQLPLPFLLKSENFAEVLDKRRHFHWFAKFTDRWTKWRSMNGDNGHLIPPSSSNCYGPLLLS